MKRRSIIVAGVGLALGVGVLAAQAPGPEPFSAGGSQALRKLIREAVAPDGVYMLAEGLMLDRSARLSFTFTPTEGAPTTQEVMTAGGLREFAVQGPLAGSNVAGLFDVAGQLTAMAGEPHRTVLIWRVAAEDPSGTKLRGSSTSVLTAGQEQELIRTQSGSVRVTLEFVAER